MTDASVDEAGRTPSFKLWRPSHAQGVEMYRGTDALDATPRYLVQDYIFAATERGMCATTYRGARTLLGPGLLQVAQPGEVMTCTPLEPMTFRALECSEELLRSVGEDVFQRHVPVPHFQEHAVPDRVLEARFMALHRAIEFPTSTLEATSLIRVLLGEILARHAAKRPMLAQQGRQTATVRRVRAYLDERYTENLTIEELAEFAGLSPYHLNRTFRREVGLPPHAYQNQVRVHRAMQFLARGLSIGEAALRVGFYDQSHLHRHFKRLHNLTPMQYQASVLR